MAVDAVVELAAGQAEQAAGEAQVLGRRHPLVEGGHVGEEADEAARVGAAAGDVAAEDPDRAGVGVREAGEDAQRGRLAGAVGPEEAVDGAVPARSA